VFGVEPPRAATLLRKALNFASMLHSHSVHFFVLAAPDLLFGIGAPAAERNIVALLKAAPDVARSALRLRTIGQKVTEAIGGRGTHPVASVVGGLAAPLDAERRETLRKLADEAVPLAGQLVDVARQALVTDVDVVTSLPLETAYLGTVKDGGLDFYDGALRLRTLDGSDVEFSEDEWAAHLCEEAAPTSYGKTVTCSNSRGEAVHYRVGALARLNCAERIGTPLAQAELERFRELGGDLCHQTVMFHYARLVELLHSAESLAEVVRDDEIGSDCVRTEPQGPPRNATAHIEAPRGVLIHDYEVDAEGIVTRANLIVATQQNLHAINDTIGKSATRFLDQPDELLLNGIEFGIRCYDPCLSCATHRVGEMKLDVTIRERGAVIRRVRR
jgi:coenzyme F420-reducing hydrogenase alpha subunit